MPAIYAFSQFKRVTISLCDMEADEPRQFHLHFGDGWCILDIPELIQLRDACNAALAQHDSEMQGDLDDALVEAEEAVPTATQSASHGPQYDRELDDTIPF